MRARIVAAGSDPGEDHADDQGEEEHLEEQRSHANQRPDQQLRDDADRVETHQAQRHDHQQQLHQHGQHQGGGIQSCDAGDEAAQRFEQRLGGLDGELAERVVEVRAHQLQDKTQQHDQQVQAAEGLDDIDEGFD